MTRSALRRKPSDTKMNNRANEPEWKSCESGFLVSMSQRAKSARRRRLATRMSLAVAVVLVAVSLGLWTTGPRSYPGENHFGGIWCHEVKGDMAAYMAGTLPDEVKSRIEAHLRECAACREMMRKMQSGMAATQALPAIWLCDCPECQQRRALATSRVLRERRLNTTVLAASFPPAASANRQ